MTDAERAAEAEELLKDITDDLTPWEREFVESMEARIQQYGSRTFVSEKQLDMLRKIAEK